jgi:hypothetical protein
MSQAIEFVDYVEQVLADSISTLDTHRNRSESCGKARGS